MSSQQISIKGTITVIALDRVVSLLFCPPQVYRYSIIGSFAPFFCSPAQQIEIYESH